MPSDSCTSDNERRPYTISVERRGRPRPTTYSVRAIRGDEDETYNVEQIWAGSAKIDFDGRGEIVCLSFQIEEGRIEGRPTLVVDTSSTDTEQSDEVNR